MSYRWLAFALPVLAISLVGSLNGEDKPKEKNDREKLIGTWKILEYHDDGSERMGRLIGRTLTPKDGDDKYPKLVFTDTECYVLRPSKDGGIRETIAGITNVNWKTVKLDETSKPKTFDITPFKPEGAKESLMPGIYELDGKKLRIAWNETPAQSKNMRPTEFKSDAHMNLFICEKLSDSPEKPFADQQPAKKP